jgi:Flp pilus assembly pilin Flp
MNTLKVFFRDERGQDLVEYSLLLLLVAAAAILVLTSFGTSVGALFSRLTASLDAARGGE